MSEGTEHLFWGPQGTKERLLILESIVSDLQADQKIWTECFFEFFEQRHPDFAREFCVHLDQILAEKTALLNGGGSKDLSHEQREALVTETVSLCRLADLSDRDNRKTRHGANA